MNTPLVSVIIPVFNGAAYIEEALASIAAQKYPALDLILVDDGSLDNSAFIAQVFCHQTGLPLRTISQANLGPSAARNQGIRAARGELVAFLDADDLWNPAKLHTQLGFLLTHPENQVIWGQVQMFSSQNQQRTLLGQPWLGPNTGCLLIRRAVFEQVGLFDETMRSGEDLDWCLRMRENGLAYLVHPEVVLEYRRHETNSWLAQTNPQKSTLLALKKKLERQRQASS